MTRMMRIAHKWLGLVIGLQFLLWVGSGFVMSLLDMHKVHGANSRAPAAAPRAWALDTVPAAQVLASAGRPVDRIATGWVTDVPVYRLSRGKTSWLVDARDGKALTVDRALAARLAAASYQGWGVATLPRLLIQAPEVRDHTGAVWRIDMADADMTTIYVSAQTGEVLPHRNSTWRLFDFVWMLHIMDYQDRTDFNHPLVIGSAGMGLLLTLGGLWLLVVTFRVAEFDPRTHLRRRR
jgi:uncharacterized iron-regulated membrane protein